MPDLLLISVVAAASSAVVSTVAALSARGGRIQARKAALGVEENRKQLARVEASFQQTLDRLILKTEEAAVNAGIAAQMRIGAEEAARVALQTARTTARVAENAQDAAELRTPSAEETRR